MNASGRETVTRLRLPRIGLVQPLDDALYDRVYNNALFPNSTEYRRADGSEGPMISYVKEIVKRLNPKTVLSIGAGAANYDADLLSSANCYVENYLVMEPNPIHAKRVSENLKSNIVGKVTIIAEPFSTALILGNWMVLSLI